MRNLVFPADYSSSMSQRDTQRAIKLIKDTFQVKLAQTLNLDRITAPVIVAGDSGINDDLNGVERKVSFDMKEIEGCAEVVQSLAKWKRMALYRYGYQAGEGIYTDMNAIRRDDDCDNIHSIFVDQWDWERVITEPDRCFSFLKKIVRRIVDALADTQQLLMEKYPQLRFPMHREVTFITTQELEDLYPTLTPKERENAFVREHRTVFIMQIGGLLRSGGKHDGRAPDYDDWSLNGDILVWDEVLGSALELSSMGIRVDAASLAAQLEEAGASDRSRFAYHQGILNGTLPLTIGGGIGQSRICMFLLEKAHIGEVQVSVWPADMIASCREHGIILL